VPQPGPIRRCLHRTLDRGPRRLRAARLGASTVTSGVTNPPFSSRHWVPQTRENPAGAGLSFGADDGTRTHDLLHGKDSAQNGWKRPERVSLDAQVEDEGSVVVPGRVPTLDRRTRSEPGGGYREGPPPPFPLRPFLASAHAVLRVSGARLPTKRADLTNRAASCNRCCNL
jgi:hypothetical protein